MEKNNKLIVLFAFWILNQSSREWNLQRTNILSFRVYQ